MGFQNGRNYRLPTDLVYVVAEGHILSKAGVKSGCVIKSVGDFETPNLEAFEKAICSYPDKSKVPIHFYHVLDRHLEKIGIATISRFIQPSFFWKRNDQTGVWDKRLRNLRSFSLLFLNANFYSGIYLRLRNPIIYRNRHIQNRSIHQSRL